jgi:hypothetical protein
MDRTCDVRVHFQFVQIHDVWIEMRQFFLLSTSRFSLCGFLFLIYLEHSHNASFLTLSAISRFQYKSCFSPDLVLSSVSV